MRIMKKAVGGIPGGDRVDKKGGQVKRRVKRKFAVSSRNRD
jgi:hypothetical protein